MYIFRTFLFWSLSHKPSLALPAISTRKVTGGKVLGVRSERVGWNIGFAFARRLLFAGVFVCAQRRAGKPRPRTGARTHVDRVKLYFCGLPRRMWCGDGRASCGGRWRGAHSAIFSLNSGCATRPSRQKDGTSQGHGTSSSLQAQRVVILIVCHGEHRRLGQQGESSAAEARYNLGQQQRLHQRRSRLALQIRTAACATSWTGAATGTRVSTSATAAGDDGVRRSIFAVSTALVTIAPRRLWSHSHTFLFYLY